MTLHDKIKAYTDDLNQKGLLRVRKLPQQLTQKTVFFDSNDYLSLSDDARLKQAYQHGYQHYPTGSGASPLLSGYHANHRAIERAFAELMQVDDCLLFSSGYAANSAITALLGRIKTSCLIDKGIHASVYDGLFLSQVSYERMLHNNPDDLLHKMKVNPQHAVLMTEGIFSMSGQIAPLSEYAPICTQHQAVLLVDEAHSFGVIGEQGKGAVVHHRLSQNEVPLRMIPLGKAFAAQGAVVVGQQDWINGLLQAGRSAIYSTAISPALSYGLLKTLDVVVQADDRRQKLIDLITLFREQIQHSPFNWTDSHTPIQQLKLGCPHRALRYADELLKRGFSCSAIRAPTVSPKSSGLRIIINYRHQPEDITQLFNQLNSLYERSFN